MTTLKITALAICITLSIIGMVLHSYQLIPFPYNNAPAGLPIGIMTGFLFVSLLIIPADSNKLSNLVLFTAGSILFILFLQGLLPLNLENFHITTTASRVSLIFSISLGGILAAIMRYKKPQSNEKINANSA